MGPSETTILDLSRLAPRAGGGAVAPPPRPASLGAPAELHHRVWNDSDRSDPPPVQLDGAVSHARRHHDGRCKPSPFVHKGECAFGVACNFCHLCAPGEKKQPARAVVRRAGVARAAFNVSVKYDHGTAVEKTSRKARELYEEARRAGFAQAACNLGVMYRHGEGVEKKITKGDEHHEGA